jgi:hypothetical protein
MIALLSGCQGGRSLKFAGPRLLSHAPSSARWLRGVIGSDMGLVPLFVLFLFWEGNARRGAANRRRTKRTHLDFPPSGLIRRVRDKARVRR